MLFKRKIFEFFVDDYEHEVVMVIQWHVEYYIPMVCSIKSRLSEVGTFFEAHNLPDHFCQEVRDLTNDYPISCIILLDYSNVSRHTICY